MNEVSSLVPQHLLREESKAPAKNAMGKDDFMKLLMAQLQHQDPMKPMDHQAFGTQLAQFSQLEQLSNIGAGIQNLRTDRTDDSKLQALGMIGKTVHASGNEVTLNSGQSVEIRPQLSEGVQPIKISIYDAGMKLVNEIHLNEKNMGDSISWDGKSAEGNPLPSGKYSFRVHGIGRDGKGQEIATELSGRVTGVDVVGTTPMLMVQTPKGSVRLELSKVTQVTTDEMGAKTPIALPNMPTTNSPKALSLGNANAPSNSDSVVREEASRSVDAAPSDETADPLDEGQHTWSGFIPSLRG